MKGILVNYSPKNKAVQLETNYNGDKRIEWYEVPNEFLELFESTQKSQEVDFLYEKKDNKLTLTKFVPSIPEGKEKEGFKRADGNKMYNIDYAKRDSDIRKMWALKTAIQMTQLQYISNNTKLVDLDSVKEDILNNVDWLQKMLEGD